MEACEWAAAIAKRLRPLGDRVTLREAALLAAFAGTIFDPSASILNFFADPTEGKLPTNRVVVNDWRDEAKDAGLNPDELKEVLIAIAMAKMRKE